jgi:predicted nucleic acid-binding protein
MIGVDTTFLVQLEIVETPAHVSAHQLLRREVLAKNEVLALAPQVVAEFVHIVTDPRRFQRPLTIEQALTKARFWWTAGEVRHVYPTAESMALWLDWMDANSLGRKRLLDTQLAALLWSAGIRRIITSNARDFAVFSVFELLQP